MIFSKGYLLKVCFGIVSLGLMSCSSQSNTAFNQEQFSASGQEQNTNIEPNTTFMKQENYTIYDEITSELTFDLSDEVNLQKVTFKNRYGIDVAAHLYTSKDLNTSEVYPAIIVGTPYGGVKEQGAGIYAQEMAKRGFIALAIDESFNGESGGEPRHVSSPEIFVEDYSAAVDFLGTREYVNRDKIGVIGICGAGGFSLTAAQVDPRIKAVVTASMYDISSMIRDGFGNSLTDEARKNNLQQVANQRWEDFISQSPQVPEGFPRQPAAEIPEGMNPVMSEFFEYYAMQRGFHPNAGATFTTSSAQAFSNFSLMSHLEDISPRPVLMIIGENGHSNAYSEAAFEKAAEPKELYVVPGARHIDLYDGGINGENYIPFDKIEQFFTESL